MAEGGWVRGETGEGQNEREQALGHHSGGDRATGSEVSGGLGGEGLDAAGVTVFAEDVSIQRVAALVVPLRQQRATVLHEHKDTLTDETLSRSAAPGPGHQVTALDFASCLLLARFPQPVTPSPGDEARLPRSSGALLQVPACGVPPQCQDPDPGPSTAQLQGLILRPVLAHASLA